MVLLVEAPTPARGAGARPRGDDRRPGPGRGGARRSGQGALSAGPTHVLSVYGGDRRGLVHAASTALADLGCNVTDLETRVLGVENPVYAMVFEVVLPDGVAPEVVGRARAGSGRGARGVHPRARRRRVLTLPERPVVRIGDAVLKRRAEPVGGPDADAGRRPRRHHARLARLRRAGRAADRRRPPRVRARRVGAPGRQDPPRPRGALRPAAAVGRRLGGQARGLHERARLDRRRAPSAARGRARHRPRRRDPRRTRPRASRPARSSTSSTTSTAC